MHPRRLRPGRWSLALAALATLVVAPAGSANGPDDRLAYARLLPGGGAEILTAESDGSDERLVPLGDLAEDFAIPLWSPDRSHLLITNILRFDGSGELLPFRPAIVKPDGSDYRLLEIPDGPFDMYCSSWNGDGTRILCAAGGDEPGIVSIRASDGGDARRITTSPFGPAGSDVPWDVSPDGSRILFIRERPGPAPDAQPYRPELFALYSVGAGGTGLRQITPFGTVMGHEIQGARWSPDGRSIITSSPRGKLFVVHPDGGAIRYLKLDLAGRAFEPAWSPDGSRIVFNLLAPDHADLYTADADGSDPERVTETPDFENGPDWH